MAAAPAIDIKKLKNLVPLDSLSEEKLREVSQKSTIQKISAGRTLFKTGDRDKWTVFLLEGELEPRSGRSRLTSPITGASRPRTSSRTLGTSARPAGAPPVSPPCRGRAG